MLPLDSCVSNTMPAAPRLSKSMFSLRVRTINVTQGCLQLQLGRTQRGSEGALFTRKERPGWGGGVTAAPNAYTFERNFTVVYTREIPTETTVGVVEQEHSCFSGAVIESRRWQVICMSYCLSANVNSVPPHGVPSPRSKRNQSN